MEDRGPEATAFLVRAAGSLASFLAGYGYRRVDVPVLEETELFLRKSGGELASRMYTFTDPGGHRASLRPEFTSSVVRAYLQELDEGPLPLRWQYQGPVFRYESDEIATYRQFTQAGAELIGASGPWADAEVLALACNGLTVLGVKGHSLVIGHLGFIAALLESLGLSDRARMFLLANVAALRQEGAGDAEVRQRALSLGLLAAEEQGDAPMPDVVREETLALLERSGPGESAAALGVRSTEEIRERYLRKRRLSEDPGRFGAALDLVTRVAQVSGGPEEAVRQVRALVGANQGQQELDALDATLDALTSYGLGVPVTVDFGLARGIAYYTGVVFEVRHPSVSGGPSLGGGGRYDGLVKALGGREETPAMGFAWAVEQAVQALTAAGVQSLLNGERDLLLVRAQEPAAHRAAVKEAERLQAQGNMVELDVSQRPMEACLRYAVGRGIRRVLSVGTNGEVVEDHVPEWV